jgi:DNA-directed RNA polymerase subunit K/omega
MIETVHINEVEQHSENIYEAIVVVAKRSRQINDEQKQLLIHEQDEYDEDYDSYEEEETPEIIQEEDFIRLPKPPIVALGEFLDGKLEVFYRDASRSEEAEST